MPHERQDLPGRGSFSLVRVVLVRRQEQRQRDKTSLRYCRLRRRRLHPCCLTNNCVSDTNHCKVGLICSQTISHESAVQEKKSLRILEVATDLPPGIVTINHNKFFKCSHCIEEMRYGKVWGSVLRFIQSLFPRYTSCLISFGFQFLFQQIALTGSLGMHPLEACRAKDLATLLALVWPVVVASLSLMFVQRTAILGEIILVIVYISSF